MGAIHKEVGSQVDCLEWPVTEHLPMVAECLNSLPIGWTYLCVAEGVCFAHVKIGSTRKNVVCDKAVYLSVVDEPRKRSASSSNFALEELQLEIELRDMISFEGRIFRRRVAKCLDIIDLLKEIASGSDTVGRETEITFRDARDSTSSSGVPGASPAPTTPQLNPLAPVPLAINADDVKYQDQLQLKELKAQEQQIKLQEIQLQKMQEQQHQLLLSPTTSASSDAPSREALQREQTLLAMERETQARRLTAAHQQAQADATALVALRKQQQQQPPQQHQLALPSSQASSQLQPPSASQAASSPDQRELLYDTEPQTQPQNLSVNSGGSAERGGPFKIKKEPGLPFHLSDDSMQSQTRDANNRLLALAGSAAAPAASSMALVPVSASSSANAARETPSEAGSLESREVQETLRMKQESSSSSSTLLPRDVRELQHQLQQQQQLQRAAVAAAAAAAGQSSSHSAFGSSSFGLPPSSTAALQSIPAFATWMQQQTMGSGAGLISPSSGGDPRRELLGGALHFDHDDAFPDSLDLDRSGGPPSGLGTLAGNEGERPHKCRICGRGFKTKAHHKEHMRLHSSICEFKCPLCFREFKQKSCFTHHLSRVHKNEGKL